MRRRGLTHPAPVVKRGDAVSDALGIAWAIALDNAPKFVPVDCAKIVMTAFRIPLNRRIRQGQAQKLRLRHGRIDEFLPQVIIADALDAPIAGGGQRS